MVLYRLIDKFNQSLESGVGKKRIIGIKHVILKSQAKTITN